MDWTAPIMIVSYVFLVLFTLASNVCCNTLHDIHRTLEEIASQMRSRPSWWDEGEGP